MVGKRETEWKIKLSMNGTYEEWRAKCDEIEALLEELETFENETSRLSIDSPV